MDLTDRRILLDGLNLELAEGTGIQWYARRLMDAIHAANGRIDMLLSCPVARDPVVQEALIDDAQRQNRTTTWRRAMRLPRTIRSACMGMRARPITLAGTTVAPDGGAPSWRQVARCLTAPDVFDIAQEVSLIFDRPTTLRLGAEVDLVHLTSPLPLAVRGAPTVTTIHDLIPLRMPWVAGDHKRVFHAAVQQSVAQSRVIVCVSEHTKRDLIDLFDVDESRLHVTYAPVDGSASLLDDEALTDRLRSYGLERGRYLLFVGAHDPKKNLKRVLQALTLASTRMPLVMVGPRGDEARAEAMQAGRKLERDGRLIDVGYLPKRELGALYQGACGLVFPSVYEGFGVPPLEAMQHDCPVLASDRASLPEVCGEAALFTDPFNVEDIAARIDRLTTDATLRQELIEAGRAQLQHFTAEQYRTRLLNAYSAALR